MMEDLLLSVGAITAASFSGIVGMLGRFDIIWSYAEFCLNVRSGRLNSGGTKKVWMSGLLKFDHMKFDWLG